MCASEFVSRSAASHFIWFYSLFSIHFLPANSIIHDTLILLVCMNFQFPSPFGCCSLGAFSQLSRLHAIEMNVLHPHTHTHTHGVVRLVIFPVARIFNRSSDIDSVSFYALFSLPHRACGTLLSPQIQICCIITIHLLFTRSLSRPARNLFGVRLANLILCSSARHK